MIRFALLPFALIGVIIYLILWALILIALISLLNWNLVLGFFLVIVLLTGAYHWWFRPDET